MPYIGTDINYGDIAKQVATSPGGGSTTPTGSLTYTVPKSESIMVMLDGVTQVPGVDYNVTLGTVLTFTSTVPENVVVLVYFLGRSLDLNTPAADTVGIAQLSATGTPSASTALLGDNSWGTIEGSVITTAGTTFSNYNTISDDTTITTATTTNMFLMGPISVTGTAVLTIAGNGTFTII